MQQEPPTPEPKLQLNGSDAQRPLPPSPLPPLPRQPPASPTSPSPAPLPSRLRPENGSSASPTKVAPSGWRPAAALLTMVAVIALAALVLPFGGKTTDQVPSDVQETLKREWQQAVLQVGPAQDRPGFVNVTVWDNFAEDGDTVTIKCGTFSETVKLTHAGKTLVMPRPSDGIITIVGVYDGGGGITLGIIGSGVALQTPVFQPGEILTLSVR